MDLGSVNWSELSQERGVVTELSLSNVEYKEKY